MAFGSRGQKQRGGQRGMRQNNGKRPAGHTLRPAPAHDASNRQRDSSSPERPWLEEQDDENVLDYNKALTKERKPLEGCTVTVSGCGKLKSSYLDLAEELGAEQQTSMTEHTTHLIADEAGSPKFDMAVRKKMTIMLPSWLDAVREAWTSGQDLDTYSLQEIEEQHRFRPLHGLKICLTHFAQGPYKRALMEAINEAGGPPDGPKTYTAKLTQDVTHLVLPSLTADHREADPNLDKISHSHKLPQLAVVWEGWLQEVLRLGGRLSSRDTPKAAEGATRPGVGVWTWNREGREPEPLMGFQEDESAKRKGKSRAVGVQDTLIAGAGFEEGSTRKRARPNDAAGDLGAAGEDEEELQVAQRKRKTRPSLSARVAPRGGVDDLLQDFGSQHASTSQLPLPPPTTAGAWSSSSRPVLVAREQHLQQRHEMAMELQDDTTFQLGKKGKSVIKALSTSKSSSFSLNNHPTDADATGSRPRSLGFGVSSRRASTMPALDEGAGDDSGFLEELSAFVDKADLPPLPPLPQLPPAPNLSSESDEPDTPIFQGLTFALMGMHHLSNRQMVQSAIEKRGGICLVDEGAEGADWVCVDYFGAPTEFIDSPDPRIITGCWVELCIFNDAIIPPGNGLLERPLSYSVPVPGAEKLRIHVTTFEDVEQVHVKRFITDIGATVSPVLDSTCTHLIHADIRSPSGEVDDQVLQGIKVERAREWGIEIKGIEWLRRWPRETLERADSGKGKGKERERDGESEPRDITNGGDRRRSRSVRESTTAEEEPPKREGPLSSCVIVLSAKLKRADHPRLVDLLTSLGASHVKSFGATVTHLVHASNKSNESFADFKAARKARLPIVHPEWLEKCFTAKQHLNESDFPHTLDPRKGGQLAGLVASPPRKEGSAPRSPAMSRGGSKSGLGSQGVSRTEEEVVVPPRLDAREFDALLEAKAGGASQRRGVERQQEEEYGAPVEMDDLGGMDPLDQRDPTQHDGQYEEPERDPSPSPSPRKSQAAAPLSPPPQSRALFTSSPAPSSPPPPTRPRPPQHATSDSADPSSDAAPLPPLPVVAEPTRLLKEQTSLLLAQLGAAVPAAPVKGSNASRVLRKRSDQSETSLSTSHSLSDVSISSRSAPALLPDLANRHQPRRIPGYGASQHTQGGGYGDEDDEDSMQIEFDDPLERIEREKIQRLLAGGGEGEGALEEEEDTQASARKKRARGREIRQL